MAFAAKGDWCRASSRRPICARRSDSCCPADQPEPGDCRWVLARVCWARRKLIFGKGSGGWSPGEDAHPAQLYNLNDDLPEKQNVYADRPEIVTQLNHLMQRLIHDGRSTPGPAQANDVPVRWKSLQ